MCLEFRNRSESLDRWDARQGGISDLFERLLWRFFHLDHASDLYSQLLRDDGDGHIVSRALRRMNIRFNVSGPDSVRIPGTGPLIVTANHPFGAVEGLILASILFSVRPDVKLMGNSVLKHVNLAGFRDTFIFIDPFGRKDSLRANVRPLREAVEWVKNGGALGIFPAGEVSHFQVGKRCITDPEWNDTVARMVLKTGASVVPVFFEGSNSALFQMAGLLHRRIRTLMLIRELFNKSNRTIRVRVGRLVPHEKLTAFTDSRAMTRYLRLRTYMLEKCEEGKAARKEPCSDVRPGGVRACIPIAQPYKTELLPREVDALPPEQRLVRTKEFSVFYAESIQIPLLLREIGRLREITFRESGEGTGRPIDLDLFDRYYVHLFLWHHESKQVAGGYRIGLTDRQALVMRRQAGLYTRTLFRYGAGFLAGISPALELGRSFVRKEYQKTYQPLLLLWKGIGRYVAARPRYKILFGPVSINSDYRAVSRDLIVAFSKANEHPELARLVRGANPVRPNPMKGRGFEAAGSLIPDVHDLSELISDMEEDGKGVPVLLKHYLKLGGKFLAFSTDPNFSNVVDALVMVDLTRVEPAILTRYMGVDAAEFFLRFHNQGALARCA